LDDDGGMALDGVHDRGGLVGVRHRRAGEMDAAPRGVGQLPPDARALVEDLGGFWVVGDACHGGAAKEQVRAEGWVDVAGEAGHHTGHVLHPVPA
jgi:hypothetical protein